MAHLQRVEEHVELALPLRIPRSFVGDCLPMPPVELVTSATEPAG